MVYHLLLLNEKNDVFSSSLYLNLYTICYGWPSIGRKKNVEKTTAKNVERRKVESRNVEERDAERINVERNILKLEMSENRLIS